MAKKAETHTHLIHLFQGIISSVDKNEEEAKYSFLMEEYNGITFTIDQKVEKGQEGTFYLQYEDEEGNAHVQDANGLPFTDEKYESTITKKYKMFKKGRYGCSPGYETTNIVNSSGKNKNTDIKKYTYGHTDWENSIFIKFKAITPGKANKLYQNVSKYDGYWVVSKKEYNKLNNKHQKGIYSQNNKSWGQFDDVKLLKIDKNINTNIKSNWILIHQDMRFI